MAPQGSVLTGFDCIERCTAASQRAGVESPKPFFSGFLVAVEGASLTVIILFAIVFFIYFLSEISLHRGVVHILAKFKGRTLYDVEHDVCKMNAKSFACPMHKGICTISPSVILSD